MLLLKWQTFKNHFTKKISRCNEQLTINYKVLSIDLRHFLQRAQKTNKISTKPYFYT